MCFSEIQSCDGNNRSKNGLSVRLAITSPRFRRYLMIILIRYINCKRIQPLKARGNIKLIPFISLASAVWNELYCQIPSGCKGMIDGRPGFSPFINYHLLLDVYLFDRKADGQAFFHFPAATFYVRNKYITSKIDTILRDRHKDDHNLVL